ncbi:hypothetical protein BD410DRAFT_341327 [Rickenella mellea]|uniref:Protein kinase domain-containing protein n=1 Tax=Rickenella mellea TaxID=50990 RepID=A0A4Y7QKV4_9AGAM|nr:hypothetical protein BD410DRAFT_341327 [Rickenella mellea]
MSCLTFHFNRSQFVFLQRVDKTIGAIQEVPLSTISYVLSVNVGTISAESTKRHAVGLLERAEAQVWPRHPHKRGLGEVFVKWAYGPRQIVDLQYEASLYANELRPLQGDVVPRCYGFFVGTLPGSHAIFSCLILEYCSGELPASPIEFNRQIMVQACRLHQAGVIHGNLQDMHPDIPTMNHVVPHRRGLRFVSFTRAKRHLCHCHDMHPILRTGLVFEENKLCEELWRLETTFGVKC